ncbi:MAG: DUF5659 domain-containing protein [Candidatus Andersenbacteria bacterium]
MKGRFMKNAYQTNDFGLASTLLTLEYELIQLDRTNPAKVLFIFNNAPGLENVVAGFWNNSLCVPAQTLLSAQRNLKSRLYSNI